MTEVHPTQQRIFEAIDRIARTPDGADLYVFLQRRIMTVLGTAEAGALQSDNGERMFAAKLIGLMAKGIHESGRANTSSGGTGGEREQPVVVPSPQPIRVGGAGGTRRRITADTRVPGYDFPDE